MIQTLAIQKLTPPQLSALREALPACVAAGVLTTTRSIATFTLPEDYTGPVELHPERLAEAIARESLNRQSRQLTKIFEKLNDPAGTHLRVSTRAA